MTGMTRRNALNTPTKFSLQEIEAQCKEAIQKAQKERTVDDFVALLFDR
jgi:uncharacterized membrane-anchored protein